MRRHLAALSVTAALLLAVTISAQSNKLSDPSQLTETAPAVFRARFDTSKGAFVIEVREGNDYLQKEFPRLDFGRKATLVPPAAVR